jgi:beta-lactamase regulating signal transducer with metallopeptidase domain
LVRIQRTVWACGAGTILAIVLFNTVSIWRKVRRERPVTDPAVLGLLEDCKAEMSVYTPLTLIATRHAAAPLLYGFIRPRLLLPLGLTENFSREELRHIFLHELAHVKRADIALNWLSTALLAVHWFNPFVWWGFAQMRVDREFACDAMALNYTGRQHKTRYGETIIRLVEQFSRPAWAPGIVGIAEDKEQIKRRIQMIAQWPNRKTWRALAATLVVTLGVITFTDAQTANKEAASAPDDGSPRILKTSPEIGAKDVDPAVKEITITFDRDMAGGFSWTGGPPDFPPGRDGQKPTWKDKRTCSLPVTLQAAKYYRVGINSTSFQNFKSAQGVPVKPSAIYFTTKGASADLQQKTVKPEIVSMSPKNGANDVDPKTKELRVTFNVPMGGGFSWTGGGPSFPPNPDSKKPYWTDGGKTCVLPVELKSGAEYKLGLNSPSHKNFQSAGGVPLDPVSYTFKTK